MDAREESKSEGVADIFLSEKQGWEGDRIKKKQKTDEGGRDD